MKKASERVREWYPVTPGGTIVMECMGYSFEEAKQKLLKTTAHMPYGSWEAMEERGYEILVAEESEEECPRCNKIYTWNYSISRRDNITEICSECGTLEALEDIHKDQYKGQPYWLLTEGEDCQCGEGTMQYPPVEDCTCHIRPPCLRCMTNELCCSVCGLTPREQQKTVDLTQ